MKKQAYTLPEMALVSVVLVTLTAVLLPVFVRARDAQSDSQTCQSRLKEVALGIRQYVQDYDEKHPLVNSGKDGWLTITLPYTKSYQIFHCPSDTTGNKSGTTDYFYNARLAGVPEYKVTYMSSTILNGDGLGEQPSNTGFTELPEAWESDRTSPAWRHLDMANYSYADGHVKAEKVENILIQKSAPNISTFAPW